MPFADSSERLNVSMVKSQSRRLVFRHIFRHGPVARGGIARDTGLSQGTVKTVIDEFFGSGILVESKDQAAQVGRKPLRVYLRREARTFGVLNIQPDRCEVHLLDLQLQPIGPRAQMQTGRPHDFAPRLERFLARSLAPPDEAGALAALGIVVPGVYDEARDRVVCRIMPVLADIALGQIVARVTSAPVTIGEDVQLAALAEVGDPHYVRQPLFYFYAGAGVGGCYVDEGRVLEGATKMAGEIGQMYLNTDDRLEDLVRWPRFLHDAGVQATTDADAAVRPLLRRLTAGERLATDALRDVTSAVAAALVSTVCLLNPRTVAIGGPYATMGETFLGPVRDYLVARLMPEHANELELIAARSGEHGMVRGAAVTALERWLDGEYTGGDNQ